VSEVIGSGIIKGGGVIVGTPTVRVDRYKDGSLVQSEVFGQLQGIADVDGYGIWKSTTSEYYLVVLTANRWCYGYKAAYRDPGDVLWYTTDPSAGGTNSRIWYAGFPDPLPSIPPIAGVDDWYDGHSNSDITYDYIATVSLP
jgi:hypothetical protein